MKREERTRGDEDRQERKKRREIGWKGGERSVEERGE